MKRQRGHPRASSHDAIHLVASKLFRECGFEETTMPMIAEAAGIGRSTLFHYFSSKADILWYGYVELTEDFRGRLAAQPADTDVANGAFAAYRSLWDAGPETIRVGKDVTLILEQSTPETTGKWRVYEAWANLVYAYVLERTGLTEKDTNARAAAMAIWAAIWAAATEFAQSDSDSIGEYLREAQSAIDIRLSAAALP